MKKMKTLLTTIFVLLMTGICFAATKGRIMTDGKVSMYKDGKLITSFTQQGPIDDTALIACEGNCLVKLRGISLIAKDQSKFALKEIDDSLNLYVEAGRIDFSIADVSRQFAFITAAGYYVRTEGFLAPVSTNSSVKGYMQATDRGAEIGMTTGTMIVLANNGKQSIGPGQAMLLAQLPPSKDCVDNPDTLKDECCTDDPKTAEDECCVDDPNTEDNECAALILAGGSTSTTSGLTLADGIMLGGLGAAAALGLDATFDSERRTAQQPPGDSQPPGGGEPPPPASPNF